MDVMYARSAGGFSCSPFGPRYKAFNELVKYSIDGVLGEADRIGVEMAARLLVKCRDIEESASAAEQNLLFKYLSQFGFLAADRSKLSIPAPKKKNIFDVEPPKAGKRKLIPGTRILAPSD